MKLFDSKLICIIIMLVLIVTITACVNNKKNDSGIGENSTDDQEKNIAIAFVKDLTNEKYDAAYNNYDFDKEMKKVAKPSSLKQIMEQLKSSQGNFVKIVDTSKSRHGNYDIVAVTCEFENDYMNINVVFDKDQKIAGLNLTNPKGLSKIPENKPSNIEEQEVVVGKGKWELPGTLTLPKGEGPFPAVVLVHGSGPNDRDETIGPNKPFRDIAWGLAEKGIIVLRYEKRTKEHSEKLKETMHEFTVQNETIDDALLAVELLTEHVKIDEKQIYVLGHSLGGYLIPRIGEQKQDIAGFIIMAGPTRPLEDLIVEQINYIFSLDDKITEKEQQEIDKLKEAQRKIKDPNLKMDTDIKELMGINAKYWIDLRDYKPTEVAKKLNRPILILQGKRDYQVTMEDFNNWKNELEHHDNVRLIAFDNLNHLFIAGEGVPTPGEYNIKGSVSQEVIDNIVLFIKK